MISNVISVRFAGIPPLISLLVATACPGYAAPAPLEELLAKANQASGAPYRYHIRSEGADASKRALTVDEEGLAYRSRHCDRTLCVGDYFDGRKLYDVNFNDTALPTRRGNPLQVAIRSIASYAFTDPNFRAAGGRLAEREPLVAGERTFRRITILPPGGIAMDALLDESTSLLAGLSSLDGAYRLTFRDSRRVGDMVLPFAIDLNGVVLERFERRTIAGGRLTPPAGLIPQFDGPARAVAMLRPERPVVPCRIGERDVRCLIDTGNNGMAMSLELSEDLKLEPLAAATEVRGIGSYMTGVAQGPPISVGAATFPSALYTLLHDIHGYGYDVVLGADVLAHSRVIVDYPRQQITVAPAVDVSDRHPLALAFEHLIPVVDVRLADQDVRLMIDTGDDSTINLADDYYARHPTLFKPTGKARVGGAGGTVEQLTGEINGVRIAGFTLDRQKIGAQPQSARVADGHLGSGLLSHFSVTFDYAHGRIDLEPRSGDAAFGL